MDIEGFSANQIEELFDTLENWNHILENMSPSPNPDETAAPELDDDMLDRRRKNKQTGRIAKPKPRSPSFDMS